MGSPEYECEFTSTLRRTQGAGGWVFAAVPDEHAPKITLGWGRTPVRAVVDGNAWDTSVWRSRNGVTELAVPKAIRGNKDHGDSVVIELRYSGAFRE